MSKHTVTLTDNETGKQVELEVLSPTQGPKTIDIRKLYAETGMFTYDPGYMSTASCASGITYMDGGEGLLEYRGYPIEQLAEDSTFLETCYLLMNGELPTKILRRLQARRSSDGYHGWCGRRTVCFLSRLH